MLLCLSSVHTEHNLKANHLLMLADRSFEPHIHRVLKCRKEDSQRPPLVSRVCSLSVEAGARASTNVAFKLVAVCNYTVPGSPPGQ